MKPDDYKLLGVSIGFASVVVAIFAVGMMLNLRLREMTDATIRVAENLMPREVSVTWTNEMPQQYLWSKELQGWMRYEGMGTNQSDWKGGSGFPAVIYPDQAQ